jgi:hypothetical protein
LARLPHDPVEARAEEAYTASYRQAQTRQRDRGGDGRLLQRIGTTHGLVDDDRGQFRGPLPNPIAVVVGLRLPPPI